MPKPSFRGSFFIVGAPRCGTTSLSKTLAAHPQVYFSKPKETHFFAHAQADLPAPALRETFLRRYFPGRDLAGAFLGEGSVSTLYVPEAQGRIQRFDPAARFIVTVRNPVDMIASYHARLLYSLDEDQPDLARAWSLQNRRRQGKDLPARCREPRLLQYGDMGSHGRHVGRLFETVGRENCFVVNFDDLNRNPASLYTDLLAFIGLEDDGRRTFIHKNNHSSYRSRWLQQYVMNPPPWIGTIIARRQARGRDSLRVFRTLRRYIKKRNRVSVQRPAMEPALRAELTDYFSEDVRLLSELLGRDLGHWR